jgi:metal-sulfur cluster biosynthetic enzyme
MPDAGERDGLRADILAALDEIKDPCSVASGSPLGLVEMGLIKQLDISSHGQVAIELCLTAPFCHMIAFFQQETSRRIGGLEGVTRVSLKTDNGLDWSPERMSPQAQARREKLLAAAMADGLARAGKTNVQQGTVE